MLLEELEEELPLLVEELETAPIENVGVEA
jgi:hypothetical protein